MTPPSRAAVALAFTLLYVVWGSTYLAMRIAVRTLSPFIGASARFVIAGGVLYAVLRLRGERAPSRVEWKHAGLTGVLLFCGGNGAVMWTQQYVPSSVAALVLATAPIWFSIFEWLRPGGLRPTVRTLLGLCAGTLGALVLAAPDGSATGGVALGPLALLIASCMTWVGGSLYGKHHPRHESVWMQSAQNMLCGGVGLFTLACATGELARFSFAAVSHTSWLALAYLVVFGAWLGFGSYAFLLAHVAPERVATYAYVNPVIAVLLGTLVANEPFTLRTALASTLILTAVAAVQLKPRRA
jgi:drug/metabolite transporter (DMT)-like permease